MTILQSTPFPWKMDELIYNQHNIPKAQWRYGLRPSAATGCGWIATHNALHLLGYREEIPELISYYEHQLPFIHGNLGTSFWGPALCFRQWGFPVKIIANRCQFDQAAMEAPACVLFYRWKSGCRLGAHFVALHHTSQGFVGYNTYRNSTGPDVYGDSLERFLKQKKYFGAILICIQKKPL